MQTEFSFRAFSAASNLPCSVLVPGCQLLSLASLLVSSSLAPPCLLSSFTLRHNNPSPLHPTSDTTRRHVNLTSPRLPPPLPLPRAHQARLVDTWNSRLQLGLAPSLLLEYIPSTCSRRAHRVVQNGIRKWHPFLRVLTALPAPTNSSPLTRALSSVQRSSSPLNND